MDDGRQTMDDGRKQAICRVSSVVYGPWSVVKMGKLSEILSEALYLHKRYEGVEKASDAFFRHGEKSKAGRYPTE